jgi:hypothetical protein
MALKNVMIGTKIGLRAEFRNKDDQLVDPTTVTFYVKDPAGTKTSHVFPTSPGTSQESLGVFWFQFAPAVAGTYKWGAEGTGAAEIYEESPFTLKAPTAK